MNNDCDRPSRARPCRFFSYPSLALGACATRPVNPRLDHFEPGQPYAVQRAAQTAAQRENLVILAFSGGGTRAAAFAYGVLEVLRNTDAVRSGRAAGPAARPGRRHHRDLRRQLHGARVRAVRREALRRVREALSQAQRPGPARQRRAQPAELGRAVIDRLGTLRARGEPLRRDPVQRRDVFRRLRGQGRR